MGLGLVSTGLGAPFVLLFYSLKQFVDSGFFAFAAVEPEKQLWGASQAQAISHFVADVSFGSLKALQAAIRFSVVTIHFDQNLCRAAILGHMHTADADQANAWVGQFAFHESLDFFPQRLGKTSAMMLGRAFLQTTPRIKRKRISENGTPVFG
jgi:hypothetical protein